MASDDEREAHLADVHKDNATKRERFLLRCINEARAEIARLEEQFDGNKEPCVICGEPCSSLAGNPSRWPVRLDNAGWRHIGCVNNLLARFTGAHVASAMEEAETILDEVLAILFDGTKPRVYQREQAEAPIARAIEAAERRGATVRLASETATESALRRAAALLAVFEDGRVWVRGKDSIQDVANEITASERLAERRGREAMREEAAVGKEIIEIMAEYDRQEAAHEYGTPGGLEHMGDVWNLLDGWRNRLVRALPIDPPQEKTDVSVP